MALMEYLSRDSLFSSTGSTSLGVDVDPSFDNSAPQCIQNLLPCSLGLSQIVQFLKFIIDQLFAGLLDESCSVKHELSFVFFPH